MKKQFQLSLENLLVKLTAWFDAVIVNLPNFVLALLVLLLAFYVSKRLSSKITNLLGSRVKQGSIRTLIGSAISITIIILGIILTLGILNLDQALNSLIAGAGVAGLAIGLAVQGTLSNTFSGVSLSIKDDINVGDFVETNGYSGTVEAISLRDTKIRSVDNNLVIIPNNAISDNPYKNFSLTKDLRVILELGVGYESDLRKVKEITTEILSNAFPLGKDSVEFNYISFSDSSIDFQVRFWIQSKEKFGLVKARSKAIMLIKERFDDEGINIPYPTRTVVSV